MKSEFELISCNKIYNSVSVHKCCDGSYQYFGEDYKEHLEDNQNDEDCVGVWKVKRRKKYPLGTGHIFIPHFNEVQFKN